ncbi:IS630 transposase-related protein [Myxococcota bacterium]|nr:IS630 transposase-related protein [Myxococcota bacterium]MBU1896876.1 IS630 transposase-related protein [Myxococcota bacterium]
MTISKDMRERVVQAYFEEGQTYQALATRFNVSTASVCRWVNLKLKTGDVRPKPHGGGTPFKIAEEDYEALRGFVEARAEQTCQELAEAWSRLNGVEISASSMYRAIRRAKIPFRQRPRADAP